MKKRKKILVLFLLILLLSGCAVYSTNNDIDNANEDHINATSSGGSVDCESGIYDNKNGNETETTSSERSVHYESGIFDNKNWDETEGTISEDVVPDQKSAKIIAQAIFDVMQGDGPWNFQLKHVFYDEEDQIWIVSFWEDKGIYYDGGSLSIAFQKEDGKVLRIWLN